MATNASRRAKHSRSSRRMTKAARSSANALDKAESGVASLGVDLQAVVRQKKLVIDHIQVDRSEILESGGLAIVERIVELHGATIEARSDGEGKGASFVVRIPITPVHGSISVVPREVLDAPASESDKVKCAADIAGLHLVGDIGMPEENGYSLIRKVRARAREDGGSTPAIALTAYARAEDRRRARVEGFPNHVSKPVDPHELLPMIANVAGRTF